MYRTQFAPVDMARHTPAVRTMERFQRPNFYSIIVGTAPVCCAPNRQRTPARTYAVQADINNTGIITICNSMISATNGLQLDPGRAWVFSATGEELIQALQSTPMDFAGNVRLGSQSNQMRILLDVADYFALADSAGQLLRQYWTGLTL